MEIDQVCAVLDTLKSYHLKDFFMPLRQSITIRRQTFISRRALFVFLEFEDRPTCVGEVMPLVGWHRETITQARAQLIQFLDGKKTLGKWKSLYPSVEFALSSALIFKKETSISSPVNALLFGDVNSVIEHAQNLYQEGVRCFKLKLTEELSESLPALASSLPSDISFRIDGNKRWSWKKSKDLFYTLSQYPIEYLEEPFQQQIDCIECFKETGIPYAWDESLRENNPFLSPPVGLKAIVLKPSVLGYFPCLEWIRWARSAHLTCVLSHPFESGLNLSYSAQIAEKFSLKGPHGFDSYSQCQEDVLIRPLTISEGKIHGSVKVDENKLSSSSLALISRNNAVTWSELSDLVSRAVQIIKKYKLKKGDRVGVFHHSSIGLTIFLIACWKEKIVPVLFSTKRPWKWIEEERKRLLCSYIFRDFSPYLAFSQEKKEKRDLEVEDSENDATVLFTSGSTGQPKALVHSLNNHKMNAKGALEHLPFEEGDRWLVTLPFFHVSGLSLIFRALESKGSLVFIREQDEISEFLSTFSCTHISLVPTQLIQLSKDPKALQHLKKMKQILVGGASIPGFLLELAEKEGLAVYLSYGLTEMASQVCTSSLPLRTVGTCLPYRECKIAKDGEILVRGKTLFKGYLENEKRTLPLDSEGWFHTRDLGSINAEGELTVRGRKDTLFISGGENIYPEEIEKEILSKVENVEAIVVVPKDDVVFGQIAVAFVRWRKDHVMNEREFIGKCREILPNYMIPKKILSWPLDINEGLKVSRKTFIELASAIDKAVL